MFDRLGRAKNRGIRRDSGRERYGGEGERESGRLVKGKEGEK